MQLCGVLDRAPARPGEREGGLKHERARTRRVLGLSCTHRRSAGGRGDGSEGQGHEECGGGEEGEIGRGAAKHVRGVHVTLVF